MRLSSYRDLVVWQKAVDLVVAVYRLARSLPTEERFGLTSQMQRSAVSVPANIAEGYARTHKGDYLRHLSIATGSLAELETHLTIAVRLEFLDRDEVMPVWSLAQEVGKMLSKLTRSLEQIQGR
jgi:four helix bundle protein